MTPVMVSFFKKGSGGRAYIFSMSPPPRTTTHDPRTTNRTNHTNYLSIYLSIYLLVIIIRNIYFFPIPGVKKRYRLKNPQDWTRRHENETTDANFSRRRCTGEFRGKIHSKPQVFIFFFNDAKLQKFNYCCNF